jgi:1-acyl-sn-glycerol-3-phosphate acyltransferase
VDGFVLAAVLSRVRPDLKIIMGPYLKELNSPYLKDMQERAFIADNSALGTANEATPEANETNRQMVKDVNAHLKAGGAVLIFPAGLVAVGPNDAPWQDGAALMAKRAKASVVPLFVQGQPSRLMTFLRSRQSPAYRTFIPREIAGQFGSTVRFNVGTAIPSEELFPKGRELSESTQIMRDRTYALDPNRQPPAAPEGVVK